MQCFATPPELLNAIFLGFLYLQSLPADWPGVEVPKSNGREVAYRSTSPVSDKPIDSQDG